MTTLKTGYNVEKPPVFSYINGRIYVTNDFDRVQVWDGLYGTCRDAGIAAAAAAPVAPTTAAGTTTAGVHLIRFRYVDSQSAGGTYRSNASAALTQTVTAGNEKLTFSITDFGGGGKLIRSADTKVDTIRIEMTLAAGSTYYEAITVANSATTVDVNISDALLALNDRGDLYDTNSGTTDAGTGNEQPPIAAIITQCKDFTFLGGFIKRTRTVGVTNGLTTVSGTTFSTLWVGRMFQVAGDAVSYEITVATTTQLTLKVAYAGSTSASISSTIFSKNPTRLYWSAFKSGAQLPESWKTLTRARDVLTGTGDVIKGLVNWQGDLLICGLYSMERLIFIDDPAVGERQAVASRFGVWNQQCLITVNQSLYGWGPNGAWMMKGGGPAWLSRAIDITTFASTASYMDPTLGDQAHGVYDPVERCIRWFFCKTGETKPREVITFDLDGQWRRDQFRQGIDSSVLVADSNNNYRAVLSDSTNGISFYQSGITDGVPASSTGSYTAVAGGTTTVFSVNEALPSGALTANLVGRMLYRPATGEERAITANTSSQITLGTALATVLTAAEIIYVGAIPWDLVTNWWAPDDLSDKHRARLQVSFVPTTGGTIRVKLYKDFSASPLTFTAVDSTNWPKAITLVNGLTYVDITMDPVTVPGGFVAIPMFMDWARVLRAEVQCLSPAGTLRLLDVRFALGDKKQQRRVTNE